MDTNNKIKSYEDNMVFALDIGTRSVIGVVGIVENEKLKVIAIEREEHTTRAMIDGQIENIDKVSKVVKIVKDRLEQKLGVTLKRVSVAAAGRALKTQKATYEIQFPQPIQIDDEVISKLEAGAITKAEDEFCNDESEDKDKQFYLVGYTVSQYYLDNYAISTLKEHHGKSIKVDVIATFLPSEVVESLYTTMNRANLEIASLTLEPIAAINAAIPANIRLLNLALVDIGAGTSDIAVCRDGSVVGYTMATIAGDEITENIMKEYLVDFENAEHIKQQMLQEDEITFNDILGLEQTVSTSDIFKSVKDSAIKLCNEISQRIVSVNGGAPSAVFLAGGGSKLTGLCEQIAKCLDMDIKRVAVAGNNFKICAFSDIYDLNNPEYATPLGIAVSAGMNLINDSFRVMLNGKNAKLFRSGSLSVRDVLMMNGYSFNDLIGRSGDNVIVMYNGKRTTIYGGHALPAILKVNEKDARISQTVHAGDIIHFEPAIHGKPAQATIKDLVGDDISIVTILNGEVVNTDTKIKNGDVIETISEDDYYRQTMAEFMEQEEFAEELTPNCETKTKTKPEVKLEVTEVKEDKTILEDKKTIEEIPQQIDNKEEKQVETDENEEISGEIKITLNSRPLILKRKDEGIPYFLFDLLEYSDIDLEHPDGEVILKVNGEEGFYQRVIQAGDDVKIYCEKRK